MSAGSQPAAPRILLVEPHEQRRAARAQKLLSLGYRVSALANADRPPASFTHRLYDAIVVTAEDSCAPLSWCERVKHNGAKPVLIVLAHTLFSLDSECLPAIVIAESTPKAVEEKLLAFLESATLGGAAGA